MFTRAKREFSSTYRRCGAPHHLIDGHRSAVGGAQLDSTAACDGFAATGNSYRRRFADALPASARKSSAVPKFPPRRNEFAGLLVREGGENTADAFWRAKNLRGGTGRG